MLIHGLKLSRLYFVLVALAISDNLCSANLIKNIFNSFSIDTGAEIKKDHPFKCLNPIFSSINKTSISPELILITNKRIKTQPQYEQSDSAWIRSPVAREFRFHAENVTLQELEQHGFDREKPVTFLIHGYTSGYPKQPWMSAIVESYAIDRAVEFATKSNRTDDSMNNHNLFLVNWNYGARGILYPRAVANLPIVSGYVVKFLNDIILREAGVDSKRVQLIGHSLGAHLAGIIGKNSIKPLGRIYGMDPAGPCFGSLTGLLETPNMRLSPDDADQVVTVHTNSALFGIGLPLGKYSVFVEGGETQPGCSKSKGLLLNILEVLDLDNQEFDDVSCSHSRAPALLIYHLGREAVPEEECQMIAHECKDWETYQRGQCGICGNSEDLASMESRGSLAPEGPFKPVKCVRLGLDWQYSEETNQYEYCPPKNDNSSRNSLGSINYNGREGLPERFGPLTDRASRPINGNQAYGNTGNVAEKSDIRQTERSSNMRSSGRSGHDSEDGTTKSTKLFMRTSDTQPYCVFHYQIVLELNRKLPDRDTGMSLVLQESLLGDSKSDTLQRGPQNSVTIDKFGHYYNETIYGDLVVSARSLGKVSHATLLFGEGLTNGTDYLRALHINYMSNINKDVRERFSSRLCPVHIPGPAQNDSILLHNRYYFESCA